MSCIVCIVYKYNFIIINKTMCGRYSLISSDSYLVSAYEFMNESPQIAEEQLAMTMDKAQETKLQDGD